MIIKMEKTTEERLEKIIKESKEIVKLVELEGGSRESGPYVSILPGKGEVTTFLNGIDANYKDTKGNEYNIKISIKNGPDHKEIK